MRDWIFPPLLTIGPGWGEDCQGNQPLAHCSLGLYCLPHPWLFPIPENNSTPFAWVSNQCLQWLLYKHHRPLHLVCPPAKLQQGKSLPTLTLYTPPPRLLPISLEGLHCNVEEIAMETKAVW